MDFSKLTPEDFEFLTEDLLRTKGFTIVQRPGRGPDQARDMIAERSVTDDMRIVIKERYLVQCKHLAQSKRNKSVQESDIPHFDLRATQHGCNRYLVATTTTVSEGVKDLFLAANMDEKKGLKCAFLNRYDIKELLSIYPEIYDKYFNKSNLSFEEKAKTLLHYIKGHQFEVHRGALLYNDQITAVFGNDGYDDERTQLSIERLRDQLKQDGVYEIAMNVCADNYSWVIFIDSAHAVHYHDKIWEFYPADKRWKELEKEESFKRMWTHWSTPFIEKEN